MRRSPRLNDDPPVNEIPTNDDPPVNEIPINNFPSNDDPPVNSFPSNNDPPVNNFQSNGDPPVINSPSNDDPPVNNSPSNDDPPANNLPPNDDLSIYNLPLGNETRRQLRQPQASIPLRVSVNQNQAGTSALNLPPSTSTNNVRSGPTTLSRPSTWMPYRPETSTSPTDNSPPSASYASAPGIAPQGGEPWSAIQARYDQGNSRPHYPDWSWSQSDDWYRSDDGSWKKKSTKSDVQKVYNNVMWFKQVLGRAWQGTNDSISLLEFRSKLFQSADYKWADDCTQYFLLKHNLSDAIQSLVDGYENDHPIDVTRFSDPYGKDSPYWREGSAQVWNYLTTTYAGSDGDRLEERWCAQWLAKELTWLDFWSTFDSVGRELARSRGVTSLSEQEKRCRLYQAMPSACQTYLNERGYRQPGVLSFAKLAEACQAWCETHWDHKQVNLTALSAEVSHSGQRTGGYGNYGNSSKPRWPPRSKRVREDAKILTDEFNRLVISSRCGRCLAKEGGHAAVTCCGPIAQPEGRCPFCGLKHAEYQLCPQDYDTFNCDCPRCGRKHHGAWACKAPTPTSKIIAAVCLSPVTPEDPVLEVTLGDHKTMVEALIDTGAQISVLSPSVLKGLGSVVLESTHLTLTTADWSKPNVLGMIKALPVHLPQGCEVKVDFLVSATDLTRPVILSASFLKELNAVWHVGKGQLILGGRSIDLSQHLSVCTPRGRSPYQPGNNAVELCNLAVGVEDSVDEPPKVPVDVIKDISLSQSPPDKHRRLLTPDLLDLENAHPSYEGSSVPPRAFTWELAPPTPTSKLGRYVLHVPWNSSERPNGVNNVTSARRTVATDARLSSEERSDYIGVIKTLYDEKFIVPDADEVVTFLPSFPVVRKQAKSTKVRLVVDPSQDLNPLCWSGNPPMDTVFPASLL
ncbi:hypothetical protein FOL47_000448 [Perkinsus chesapeaki]|uniref:Peptidase A2 domain-containing protein n=1 Tax=Perkinsus chesapeaki TaxID=330153 RepID=A0A7J6KY80_PERCH|nr:hypothetical protein FOL47_000448 [Perkinsus chesapeaki]